MPAEQRGSPYKTSGGWGVRWVEHGKRRHHSGFPSKSAALAHFRDVVRPRLVGASTIDPSITLAEFVELYLDGSRTQCCRQHARDPPRPPAPRD